uniref:Receptor ligand binding region domain-containing protein n=1 Tax=Panagrolaimus sp. JU765 TaxID=591449 RepID=A0AC34R5Y9_9BILA
MALSLTAWIIVSFFIVTTGQEQHLQSHFLPYNALVVLPQKGSINNKFDLTIPKVMPVIDIAVEDVIKQGIMPNNWINLTYHDSRFWEDEHLAERWATNGVIQAYCEHRLDSIFGFADPYSLKTVAQISAGFGNGIPIFTTIGYEEAFLDKNLFPFVTRMQGSYHQMAEKILLMMLHLSNEIESLKMNLNFKRLSFVYHDKINGLRRIQTEDRSTARKSQCYSTLMNIIQFFKHNTKWKHWFPIHPRIQEIPFDEDIPRSKSDIEKWLKSLSCSADVIILCASPDTVRDIMLSAHDLGMATSGKSIFINIDLSTGSHVEKPWIRGNEVNSPENEKAKEAYKALKTVSLKRSDSNEFKNLETRIKERAEKKYNYSQKNGKEYEMNNFALGFYDAVLLYAIGLNKTLGAGLDPRNAKNITSKIWNRTFVGVTGNVIIGQNGDRNLDYSVSDLDPIQDKFVDVVYYSTAQNVIQQITNYHWIKENSTIALKLPACGWDMLNIAFLCGLIFHLGILAVACIVDEIRRRKKNRIVALEKSSEKNRLV